MAQDTSKLSVHITTDAITSEIAAGFVEKTADSLADQLSAFAKQTGRQLGADIGIVGAYAAERAAVLSGLVGQAGFDDAVLAERDNVAVKAGITATRRGDTIDARLLGIIQGSLRTAAVLLAT